VAEEISDRIGIIKKGKLIAEGTPKELLEKSSSNNKTLEDAFLEITENE
jgi:ABC-2 type transport system ATP-binding protein